MTEPSRRSRPPPRHHGAEEGTANRKPPRGRGHRSRLIRGSRERRTAMKKRMRLAALVAVGVVSIMTPLAILQASAHGKKPKEFVAPTVFQAAGPTGESIQSTVDAYRAALGDPNNLNNPNHLDQSGQPVGRREINWDGGGANVTTDVPVTPFNVFLNTRGAQFTTPGMGLAQAPPSGGPQGGLEALFNNPSYRATFSTFSAPRLSTPVRSNITEARFFAPGSSGTVPATVRGFGAVFTDVDQPGGSGPDRKHEDHKASTLIEYFDADGDLLFSSF